MSEDNYGYRAMARGSLYETMTQLEIAVKLGYVAPSKDIEDMSVEIRRMLSTLIQRYVPYTKQEN